MSHAINFPPVLLFQGYWVFFLLEGNGPLSSIYKALQVIDFYLSFILPCHPIFGVDVSVKASSFPVLLESHVPALNQVFSCCVPCLSPFAFAFAFAGQSVVLMQEVVNTEQNHWIVQGTAGMAVAICVIMVKEWKANQAVQNIYDYLKTFMYWKGLNSLCRYSLSPTLAAGHPHAV